MAKGPGSKSGQGEYDMPGFEFSEFTDLITQLEKLGADMDKVAEHVLDAGSEPARKAYAKAVPRSNTEKEHAQDNIVVSKTKTARGSKNRYRVVEAKTKKKDSKTGKDVPYLYYVENGTVNAPAHPFLEKAYRDAQTSANEPMRQALITEIESHLR